MSGSVTVPDGVSIEPYAYSVAAYGPDYNFVASTYVATNGSYSLTGLSAGTYKLRFSSGSTAEAAAQWYQGKSSFAAATPITVKAGESKSAVDATLARPASISGVVSVPRGYTIGDSYSVTAYDSTRSSAATATIRPDGTYALVGLIAGSYRLHFSTPWNSEIRGQWYDGKDSFETSTVVAVTAGQSLSSVNVALKALSSVSGALTDATGKAVVGAPIEIYRKYGTTWSLHRVTTTDARGGYRVVGVDPAEYTVQFGVPQGANLLSEWWNDKPTEATATGFTLADGQSKTGVNAKLATAASVTGTATYSDQTPLPGAPITVYDRSGAVIGEAVTDAQGAYTVGGLRTGEVAVAVVASGGTTFAGGASVIAQATFTKVVAGAKTSSPIVVAGVTVSGKVTVAGTKTALGAGSVTLFNSVTGVGTSAPLAKDGSYVLRGVAAGKYVALVSDVSEKYVATWSGGVTARESATYFAVTSSTAVSKPLTVVRAGSVSGSLSQSGGVSLYRWSPTGAEFVENAFTGAGGAFRFVALAPGEYTIHANGYYFGGAIDDTKASHFTVTGGKELALGAITTLPKQSGTITGTVTAPLANYASVTAVDSRGVRYQASMNGLRYSFAALPVGSYTLLAQASGYPPAWYGGATRTKVTITAGSAKIADISVQSGDASLVGKITALTGAVVSGAYVTLSEIVAADAIAPQAQFASTGADGKYSFPKALRAGAKYVVSVSSPGLVERSVTFTAKGGSQTKSLVLSDQGRIVGKVVDATSGLTARELVVTAVLDGADARSYVTRTDSAGVYDFGQLAAGTYRILLGSLSHGYDDYYPGNAAITTVGGSYGPEWLGGVGTREESPAVAVVAGQTTKAADGKVTRGGTITGRVSVADGSSSTWQDGATVSVYTTAGALVTRATTGLGAPGAYTLTLKSGTYRVCATNMHPARPYVVPASGCRSALVTVKAGVLVAGVDLKLARDAATP